MDWDHFDQIPKSVRREPIHGLMPSHRDWSEYVAVVAMSISIILLVVLLWVGLATKASGREHYPGQYAQVDPKTRQWFRDQKVPGSDIKCCSEADGVFAEEEIRGTHYWVRFVAKQYNDGAPTTEIESGWMQVPDEAVIHEPNRHGAAVVWWGWQDRLFIRCFIPGAGI